MRKSSNRNKDRNNKSKYQELRKVLNQQTAKRPEKRSIFLLFISSECEEKFGTIQDSHFGSIIVNLLQNRFARTPVRMGLLKIDKTLLHFSVIRPTHGFEIYGY